MARFARQLSGEDSLLDQLKCSSCLVIMKPQIFKCPFNHSACQRCYEELECCTVCSGVYSKEPKQDSYLGIRTYDYPCRNNCHVSWFNRRSCLSSSEPFQFKCQTCGELSGKLYRFNGKLLPEAEFMKLKADFIPPRNFRAERLTALVEYPCEMEGCVELVSLAEMEHHKSICDFRLLRCPYDYCDFNSSVRLMINHVSNVTIHPECPVIDPQHVKPVLLEFTFPVHIEGGNGVMVRDNLFIFKGTVTSVIFVFLRWDCFGDDCPLQLAVAQFGPKASKNSHLSYKVRLESERSGNFMLIRNMVQNHLESGESPKVVPLWSRSFLEKGGFVKCDGQNWKIVLQVTVRDEKQENVTTSLREIVKLPNSG